MPTHWSTHSGVRRTWPWPEPEPATKALGCLAWVMPRLLTFLNHSAFHVLLRALGHALASGLALGGGGALSTGLK